ncbi:Type IV pilus modification protein PilV [uncultured Stenotrophomonas sp.]|uniref:Type IV pilus modification protein PilV n=1 Tax=uncultured Stenotrophomonas sp. TaxID=165438 RepID=A0A1Y5Q3R5_9GAMM|nr:Type IV pilus modification protein PilV [uncultured Stenotrophomonas sp.]
MSLIEVMVAVLVMAIGLLGIAAMQTVALRNSQGSLERSQAVISAYAALEAMRANRDAALAGGYNTGDFICTGPGTGSLAAADITAWINGWRTALGLTAADNASGCGNIACNAATGICEIGLRWDESHATDAAAGKKVAGSTTRTFRTKVQL